MPLEVKSAVDYRHEFVLLAPPPGANVRELCRRYRFSTRTGYKWIGRYREGERRPWRIARADRRPVRAGPRRRPKPPSLPNAMRSRAGAVASCMSGWDSTAWRIHRRRARSPTSCTGVAALRRSDHRRDRSAASRTRPRTICGRWISWAIGRSHRGRVHPLTILDDHSRFGLVLAACATQHRVVVEERLTACFGRFGLPRAILTDNGPPWGTSRGRGLTGLEAWLIRLGIVVIHGRPYHPQTQGKIERWHRTIGHDVFRALPLVDLAAAQHAFDRFRTTYSTDRPHQALGDAVPASRYRSSPRSFPTSVPEIVYSDDDRVRIVRTKGEVMFQGHRLFVSEGLKGLPVGIRPTSTDGVFTVRFCHQEILTIDLRHQP